LIAKPLGLCNGLVKAHLQDKWIRLEKDHFFPIIPCSIPIPDNYLSKSIPDNSK